MMTKTPPSTLAAIPPDHGSDEALPSNAQEPPQTLAVNHLIGADVVKRKLEEIGATQPQISSILWLHAHAKEQRMTKYGQIGDFIGYDGAKIGQLFQGKYGGSKPGSLDNVCAAIESARALFNQRLGLGAKPFVSIQVVDDMKTLCDIARASQTMALMWGPNQSGKTWAAKKYQRDNNHGLTIYVRMPAGGGKKATMKAIARACKIPDRKSPEELRDRIHAYFNDSMLLIVDEFHQCLIGRTMKVDTVEAIREIHDECDNVAVVLIGTDALPDTMNDPRFHNLLGQIGNRCALRKRIAAAPRISDVISVCHAYGMPPGEGDGWAKAREVARENGIGPLTILLRMAKNFATKKKQTLNWDHFATTHATVKSWAETSNEEDAE